MYRNFLSNRWKISYRIAGPKKEWNYSIVRKTTESFVLLFHAPYCTSACTIVHMIVVTYTSSIVDVLCRQPIKLLQVVSTSEFHEYLWNNVVSNFFVPAGFWRASEASNIDCFKK